MRRAAGNPRPFPIEALWFFAVIAAAAPACTTDELTPAPATDAGRDAADDEAVEPSDGGLADTAKSDGAISKPDAPPQTDGSPTPDAGDYGSVESLSGPAFRTGLRGLIANHTSVGYDSARDLMLGVTGTFDLTGGMLECVYTGRLVAPDGSRTPNGFNTEHTWPQSLGAGSEPARSDLHHLFPVDELANSARGNLPFAFTDCTSTCGYDNGGSKRGPISGGGADVFQVRTLRRGDIARAIFYFSVRYDQPVDAPEETALRLWHDADPPDTVESARNDAIAAIQMNRNPFIDRPDFVAKIADY